MAERDGVGRRRLFVAAYPPLCAGSQRRCAGPLILIGSDTSPAGQDEPERDQQVFRVGLLSSFLLPAPLFSVSQALLSPLHQRVVEQGGVGALGAVSAAVSGNYLTAAARDLIQTLTPPENEREPQRKPFLHGHQRPRSTASVN